MSLKIRLMALSTLWLIFILLLFNVFTYYFVVQITTKSEIQLLWKKSGTILQQQELYDKNNWSRLELLEEFLVSGEMIRVIGSDGTVKMQAVSDAELLFKQAEVYEGFHSEVISNGENRFLFVQVPIYAQNQQIGVLEIGRVLNLLDDYMGVLVTALTFTTMGAVILSIIGGYFYSKFIFKPLTYLAGTMQMIQKSGAFQKLNEDFLASADELSRLGQTFNAMMEKLELNFIKQKQFIEDASHELRTPLTIIESYASLLKRWASNNPEVREEAVEAIYSESIRLKGLIVSLMQAVDTDRSEQVHERVRIVPLAMSTVSSLKLSFRRDIELVANKENIELLGDAEKLKQMLIILLDNAIKYSRDKIRLRIAVEGFDVVLKIIDQGIGIEKGMKPYIFNRFFKVDKARSRKTGGAGLGLAIAKKIVDDHRGMIEIFSKMGLGTIVKVVLPINSPVSPSDQIPPLSE